MVGYCLPVHYYNHRLVVVNRFKSFLTLCYSKRAGYPILVLSR